MNAAFYIIVIFVKLYFPIHSLHNEVICQLIFWIIKVKVFIQPSNYVRIPVKLRAYQR